MQHIGKNHTKSIKTFGKISAQPHTFVKQICFPNGSVLFLSLFFSIQELNA